MLSSIIRVSIQTFSQGSCIADATRSHSIQVTWHQFAHDSGPGLDLWHLCICIKCAHHKIYTGLVGPSTVRGIMICSLSSHNSLTKFHSMILTGLASIVVIEIYAAVMQREFQNTDNKVGKGFAVLGIYLFVIFYCGNWLHKIPNAHC